MQNFFNGEINELDFSIHPRVSKFSKIEIFYTQNEMIYQNVTSWQRIYIMHPKI